MQNNLYTYVTFKYIQIKSNITIHKRKTVWLTFMYKIKIELKGMHLNHDFYVVVGKQCGTENS